MNFDTNCTESQNIRAKTVKTRHKGGGDGQPGTVLKRKNLRFLYLILAFTISCVINESISQYAVHVSKQYQQSDNSRVPGSAAAHALSYVSVLPATPVRAWQM